MSKTPDGELGGMSVVVTGSSSGIGRATALALATAGADVLVHARGSRAEAESTAEAVRALGRQSHVVLCDLADPATHLPLVEAAWKWRTAIDAWVNNAGADVLTGEAKNWAFERKLEELLKVDVVAAMNLSRAAGQRMHQRGAGSIVNIGWDHVDCGMAGDSGQLFAAAKGAVTAFTRSLAHSLAPAVRVNCVAPGWIQTEWGEGASQAWQQRARGDALLDRWGTPQDVAAVVRFLVSPAAGFLTAQTIAVNGGLKQA